MNTNIQHSAEVDIYFLINNDRVDIAACLDNKCTLRKVTEYPVCYADLVIVIDGKEHRKKVFLKNGISALSREVEYNIS